MPERLVGRDAVAHPLLQLLDVGEPPLRLARPHRIAVDAYLEDAAGARPQRHLADLLFEGGQQLLRHPGGAQQPSALSAVFDLHAGQVGHNDALATAPVIAQPLSPISRRVRRTAMHAYFDDVAAGAGAAEYSAGGRAVTPGSH